MKRYARTLAAVACVVAAPALAEAQGVGSKAPALDAVKWYNTPPLSLESMNKKAILVEVFRTW